MPIIEPDLMIHLFKFNFIFCIRGRSWEQGAECGACSHLTCVKISNFFVCCEDSFHDSSRFRI